MASRRALHLLNPYRSISSTPHLASLGWFDKIKSTFTGKKPEASEADSFTLIKFADTMETARKVGTFKNFVAGRASEATVVNAFEKHSAVLRYLGAIDPTGEKLKNSDKINATKHCNCTIADVEHILAKYTWAKEAQKKMVKLKEEGKPLPKTFNEIQNLMGSTPMDVAQSNLAKSGQISRNALCPCGSKKRYKSLFFAASNVKVLWSFIR
ncbi:hypothetical protein GQ55_4G238100 [Panicum hallii var. hallii]|uniref:Uncharacterized protein n=1 Tax=Panicum hallii var. hallii TaxID=1504633 RepID=A0A2T7DZN4_9POAL|nr:hypothetical protein GQ55_4G238100 [Panicum hallii var. hallii]